jgi:methyltransferase
MSTSPIFIMMLLLIIGAQRIWELRHAQRNRERALAQGGREFGAEHFPLFIVLHAAWMLGWAVEGFIVAKTPVVLTEEAENLARIILVVSVDIFLLATALRYWAIYTLGESWNTRIIVVPGAERVKRGPYKYLKHPNYVAVAMELAAVPLIFGAWRTALVASILNAALLLLIRIPAENRAMAEFLTDVSTEPKTIQ